jgi:hypothetical protein
MSRAYWCPASSRAAKLSTTLGARAKINSDFLVADAAWPGSEAGSRRHDSRSVWSASSLPRKRSGLAGAFGLAGARKSGSKLLILTRKLPVLASNRDFLELLAAHTSTTRYGPQLIMWLTGAAQFARGDELAMGVDAVHCKGTMVGSPLRPHRRASSRVTACALAFSSSQAAPLRRTTARPGRRGGFAALLFVPDHRPQ